MGGWLGGGPSVPDNSGKIKAAADTTLAGYNTTASEYNTKVGAYNSALTGLSSKVNDLNGRINGLNVTSLYDDPLTSDVNENPYGTLLSDLNSAKGELTGLNLGMDRPTFSNVANTQWGATPLNNLPTLNNANTSLYGTLNTGLDSLLSKLNELNTSRSAEERRVRDFSTSLMGELAPIKSTVGNLSIADANGMSSLESQLAALQAKKGGFSSAIAGQVMPDGFSGFDATINELTGRIGDLRTQRSAEEQRIKDFEDSLYSASDTLNARLKGTTIADEAGLKDIQSQLEKYYTDAGRFSSKLGFDLNQETGIAGLGSAKATLENLLAERDKELSRISSTEQQFRTRADGLDLLTSGLSPYDLNNLTQAQRQIDRLRSDASGFSSALNFDFNDGDLAGADAATQRLNELLAERGTKLTGLRERMASPLAGLNDIAITDEAALRERRNSLNGLLSEFSAYNGSDIAGDRSSISTGVSQIDTKLKELSTQRSDLETQAKALMERVNNANYYSSSGLTQDQADLQQMRDQVELYNAQQALDEISAIEARLQKEGSRLGGDEAAAAKRREAEQNAVKATLDANGVPKLAAGSALTPEAMALYSRYFYQPKKEETLLAPTSAGAFATSLGLA